MTARLFWLASLALLIAAPGCCCGLPCKQSFDCPDCGCLWWNEWFSHPPDCCDPCDCDGNFTCSHNRWVTGHHGGHGLNCGYGGNGGYDDGYGGYDGESDAGYEGGYDTGYEGSYDGAPESYRESAPTPARSPSRAPALAPTEEMPAPAPHSSAAYETNELGQPVSYEPPVDSPRPSRKLGQSRRARMSYVR